MDYKRTILHVDDDPQITRIVAERLKRLGYEVTSLNDPRQAMKELNRSHQRLVLLDVEMGHVNGLDLLQEIQANFGGTQVIMLTGMVTMQTVLKSFRLGAEFCVFKPIADLKPLVKVIERTFWKIDRWWETLEYLSQEKRSSRAGSVQPGQLTGRETTNSAPNSGPAEIQG